jgi:site-specific DNA recombinase
MRAAIYARISHDPKAAVGTADDPPRRGGDGLGVERQEQDCRELATRHGFEITRVFIDNDTSAYSGKRRPNFEAMLDAMKNGEFDVLVCWHTDRLYRSMKDLERLIDIAEVTRTSIRTVQSGDIDLSTSAGRMVARILGSVARQESEHMSERRVRFNIQKAELRKWATVNRVFGYTKDGVPFEPEAQAVRDAVKDVLAGKSIRKVSMEWNAAGLKTTLAGKQHTTTDANGNPVTKTLDGKWNSPRVRRLLMNPRYAGLKTYRDNVIGKGDWTALIDEDTHRGLVAHLSDETRVIHTAFERKYVGAGVYVCGRCGGKMRSARPGGRKTYAYACRDHAHLLRSGEPLDAFVTGVVVGRLARGDAHLLLEDKRIDLLALQSERNGIQARLDELVEIFAEGAIDADRLRKGTTALRTKLAVIDTQLADAVRTDPIAGLIADRELVQARWDECSPAMRGQIIDALLTVTVLPIPNKDRGSKPFDPQYIRIEWKR